MVASQATKTRLSASGQPASQKRLIIPEKQGIDIDQFKYPVLDAIAYDQVCAAAAR